MGASQTGLFRKSQLLGCFHGYLLGFLTRGRTAVRTQRREKKCCPDRHSDANAPIEAAA
jgi:hypothetical protein